MIAGLIFAIASKDLTYDDIQKISISNPKAPMLLFLYAPWCQHCQRTSPKWQLLEEKYAEDDRIKIGRVNCESQKFFCEINGASSYPYFLFMVQNFSVPQRFKEISVEEFETLIKKWLKISKKPFTKVDDSYPMYEIESEEEGIDTLVRMVLFSRTDKPNLIKNASSLHRLTVHFSSTDQISFDNITNIRQIQSIINEYSSHDFEKWTPYLLRTHSRLTIIPFNISFLLNELVPKFRKQFYFTNYSQTAVNFYPINETDLPAVVVSTRYRNYYLLKNAQSITEVDTFLESILNKTIEPINMTERDESFGDRKFLQDFEDPEFRKEFFFIFGLCVAAVVIGCILVISVSKFIIDPCRKRVTAKKEAQKQNEAKKEQ